MSAAKDIFEKLVASGMDVSEALALLSRHAAESVPPTTTKNSSATRQQRYRDRNKSVTERNAEEDETVTNRNESVTNRNEPDRNESVTKRNETVTNRNASIYISSNNSLEERKIDIPDRHALRLELASDQEAKEIARQRGLDISEVAAIYLDFLEDRGETPTVARFRNFLRKHNGPARAAAPQIGDQPSLADFDRAAALFIKDNSKWGRGMGPEPGMGGCRCPPEILIKNGIDPKTGMRMQ